MIATTLLPTAGIDSNAARPGWIALLIVLGLCAATVLLWRNMGKQLKKIDFDPAELPELPGQAGDARPEASTDDAEQLTGGSAPADRPTR